MATPTICVARRRFGLNLASDFRIHLRWLLPRDLPDVLDIEAKSFAFPWNEEDFMRCLRHDHCVCVVAESDEQVVGFMVYELNRTQARIFNLTVAPCYRRHGVATRMLKNLIDKPSFQRRRWISLVVRETNLAAQLFFRAHGFRAVSILRQFYTEKSEDAYLMRYRYSSRSKAKAAPGDSEAPRATRWETFVRSFLRVFRSDARCGRSVR
jgi:ribosomal-protein-alanine N-acetyltransferase